MGMTFLYILQVISVSNFRNAWWCISEDITHWYLLEGIQFYYTWKMFLLKDIKRWVNYHSLNDVSLPDILPECFARNVIPIWYIKSIVITFFVACKSSFIDLCNSCKLLSSEYYVFFTFFKLSNFWIFHQNKIPGFYQRRNRIYRRSL